MTTKHSTIANIFSTDFYLVDSKDLFVFGKVTNVKNFKTNHMKQLYIFSDCYL